MYALSIATAIVLLLLVVFVHELSHALVAIARGVRVKEASVGFPLWPVIRRKVRGVPVAVSPWLIGAGIILDDEQLWKLPLVKRLLVFIYGPIGNLLAAGLVAWVTLGFTWGFAATSEMFTASVGALSQVIASGVPMEQIFGPIRLVSFSSNVLLIEYWLGIVFIWLLMNCALAAFNFLPLPGLDAGHFGLSLLLANRKDGKRLWRKITLSFYPLLLTFVVVLLVNDIRFLGAW